MVQTNQENIDLMESQVTKAITKTKSQAIKEYKDSQDFEDKVIKASLSAFEHSFGQRKSTAKQLFLNTKANLMVQRDGNSEAGYNDDDIQVLEVQAEIQAIITTPVEAQPDTIVNFPTKVLANALTETQPFVYRTFFLLYLAYFQSIPERRKIL